MAVPPESPEECLRQAYEYVRSVRGRYGLTPSEVEDAAGELVHFMVGVALPRLDRTRTVAAQCSWWRKRIRGCFQQWDRDHRYLIRIPAWLREKGLRPAHGFTVSPDHLARMAITRDWEERVCELVDAQACIRRTRLASVEVACLRWAVFGGEPPEGLTNKQRWDMVKWVRRKLRAAGAA